MLRAVPVIAAAIVMAATSAAVAGQRAVGDWLVKSEADRFADQAKTNVIAVRAGQDGIMLAARCIDGELSIAVGGQTYTTGDKFVVKFRADSRAVIDTMALAISDAILQIVTPPEMLREMLTAREYAFRIIGETQTDYLVRAGRGAATALGEVIKACPLDAEK